MRVHDPREEVAHFECLRRRAVEVVVHCKDHAAQLSRTPQQFMIRESLGLVLDGRKTVHSPTPKAGYDLLRHVVIEVKTEGHADRFAACSFFRNAGFSCRAANWSARRNR